MDPAPDAEFRQSVAVSLRQCAVEGFGNILADDFFRVDPGAGAHAGDQRQMPFQAGFCQPDLGRERIDGIQHTVEMAHPEQFRNGLPFQESGVHVQIEFGNDRFEPFGHDLAKVAVGMLAGMASYLGVAFLMRDESLQYLVSFARSRVLRTK